MMFRSLRQPGALVVTLAAAGILMITMGTRQSFGLFISPVDSSTGMGIVAISFALAIGQIAWGAIQPIAGACADHYGPRGVLIAGVVILALGRSEEHTSELQSLMRISYAVFCLKKKT